MSYEPKEGDLRVWWVPQILCPAFHAEVQSPKEARRLLNVLGNYDIFQLENNIKPDFANAGGLEVFEDGDWCEWYDADDNDIDSADLDASTVDQVAGAQEPNKTDSAPA